MKVNQPEKYGYHSCLLLHGDKRGDITTADWTGMLGFDKLFTAVLAHTEMATRHDQGVLGL